MEKNKHETDVVSTPGAGFHSAALLAERDGPFFEEPLVAQETFDFSAAELEISATRTPMDRLRELPYRAAWAAHNAKANAVEIGRAIKADYRESDRKLHALGSLMGIIVVKAVGAPQLPTLFSFAAAIKIQKDTGMPLLAAEAAGSIYGAWGYGSSRMLNSGINHLPNTCETIHTNMKSTDKLSSVLPGLKPSEKQKLGTRIGRGVAVNTPGIGNSLYLLSAGLQNQDKAARLKLCENLSGDGASVMGAITLGVTSAFMVFEHSQPEVAERILERAGDNELLLKVLIGGTALKLAASWASKKVKDVRNNRLNGLKPVPAT